jgi:excisionase family DNA binding protein
VQEPVPISRARESSEYQPEDKRRRPRRRSAGNVDRRLYDRPAACRALSIGDRKLRQLIADGELESVLIGDRRLIPVEAIDEYVARLRNKNRAS